MSVKFDPSKHEIVDYRHPNPGESVAKFGEVFIDPSNCDAAFIVRERPHDIWYALREMVANPGQEWTSRKGGTRHRWNGDQWEYFGLSEWVPLRLLPSELGSTSWRPVPTPQEGTIPLSDADRIADLERRVKELEGR